MFSRLRYLKLRVRRSFEWAKLGWTGRPLIEAIKPGAIMEGWRIVGHISIPPWMVAQEPSPIVQHNYLLTPDTFPRVPMVQGAEGVAWNRPMTRTELDNTLRASHLA